jgi:hypothetical protein
MNPLEELSEDILDSDLQEVELVEDDAERADDPSELPRRPPTPGHTRFRHLHKKNQTPLPKEFERATLSPRPAWMQDGGLLPKRPPGKR